LLSVIGLLFLSLTVEALQGKRCQDWLLSGGIGQFERRFQGEGVVPGEYFFGFYKTRHILLSTVQTAPCYVPSFWHNTGVWRTGRRRTDRQTDRQTDGIAVAGTALTKRRAIKLKLCSHAFWCFKFYKVV